MGNANAKIAFVGEAPSFEEERLGQQFVGPSGRIFDEICRNAGIRRSDCWITNVFKYIIIPQVKKGKKIPAFIRAEQAGVNVQESIQHLRTELDDLNPNVVVLLGGTALQALKGTDKITNWRGSILHLWNRKCIPSYHPASLIHGEDSGNYWTKFVMEFDYKRALRQSSFPEIIKFPRNLQVCRNSAQLAEFYKRAKERSVRENRPIKLSVDIEAIHCVPVCIGLSFDKHEGLSVPLWNRTSLCRISDISSSDLAAIWLLLDKILTDKDVE